MKQTLALFLSLAAVCSTAPAGLGLSFDKRAGSLPTLKLSYATYQAASYDPNGDVCLPSPPFPTQPLTYRTDLHLQKHSLRCPSDRRSAMGETRPAGDGDRSPRWLLRPHLHPSTPQRASIDRSWRQQPDWGDCESISGWNTPSVF